MLEGKPHGQGELLFSGLKDKQQISARFVGEFSNGDAVFGEVAIGDLVYKGEITEGKITGKGTLINRALSITYEGTFENGRLREGLIHQEGSYKCKGSFE